MLSTTPDWSVACVSAGRSIPADCTVEQKLIAKQSGLVLSVLTVAVPGATRKPMLMVLLPNGLSLPDGVTMAIDKAQAQIMTFQSCDARGCLASLPLTLQILGQMEGGKTLSIRVKAANGTPIIFDYVLRDFAASYKAAA